MEVPFIDFREQYQIIKEEIDVGLKSVFERGAFILGQEEKDFELDFAKYCDASYGIGVNSGTDALYLSLSCIGVGPGDEVILPSFTFIATALCVSYTGATPVFVDIEEETYNIDPEKFKEAITDKTKAVIPVHLYGQPANMNEIVASARDKNITVIEDAAQAHGATYNGKKVGSLGDIACFSFYPTKSLGAFGDGGMIITNNAEVNDKAFMLRDYGRKDSYDHVIKGFNSRLDTVQAVVLAAKLKRLDDWNKKCNELALMYFDLLEDLDDVFSPRIKADRTHVFQTFAVRVKNRDKVLEAMKKKGIGVLVHYPIPVHLQVAYAELGYKKGDIPVSEKISGEILSLPMFPHMKKEQVEYVCGALREILI
ncbi:MAG: DegT/DnrJ/EryC1/StrS family aminotransferase [Candidatus Omnitrophica bacterium]|nr:DegT/DnrJ/EryC1/StrS family aminotransferase [Candidatus Omnitrophota bacterium]MBU1997474.1 DegT/DnrJ/EryC1/StrS family aminotransferase [Candidatus Omnitrophota bacterium]MBU4333047.1 DegT/DnrJ/EryC1/StrS family aminotransferase [Candidatus Omnitrophota bacterium]